MSRKIMVFGASGELGSVVSKTMAAEGCQVVLHGFTNNARLHSTADEVNSRTVVCGDVREESEIVRMLREANAAGPITAIVYAVGVNPSATLVAETPLSVWRDTLDINLTGAFLCVKHALPTLRLAKPFGSIVLVSSIFGITAPAYRGAYAVAKHGLSGLVQCVAKEEGAAVRINGLCPGPMWSENVRHIFARHAASVGISVEEYVKERTSRIPFGRFLALEECANVVALLLDERAAFLTGEIIRVSGGEV